MTLKTFVDRLQMAAVGLAAMFIIALFVGWPGTDDDPGTPGGGVPTESTEVPETSELPNVTVAPETTEFTETTEG